MGRDAKTLTNAQKVWYFFDAYRKISGDALALRHLFWRISQEFSYHLFIASDLHNCDLETEVCLDRTGSFDCVCKEGFKKDGSGRCVSISLDCGPGFRLSSDGLICQGTYNVA